MAKMTPEIWKAMMVDCNVRAQAQNPAKVSQGHCRECHHRANGEKPPRHVLDCKECPQGIRLAKEWSELFGRDQGKRKARGRPPKKNRPADPDQKPSPAGQGLQPAAQDLNLDPKVKAMLDPPQREPPTHRQWKVPPHSCQDVQLGPPTDEERVGIEAHPDGSTTTLQDEGDARPVKRGIDGHQVDSCSACSLQVVCALEAVFGPDGPIGKECPLTDWDQDQPQPHALIITSPQIFVPADHVAINPNASTAELLAIHQLVGEEIARRLKD